MTSSTRSSQSGVAAIRDNNAGSLFPMFARHSRAWSRSAARVNACNGTGGSPPSCAHQSCHTLAALLGNSKPRRANSPAAVLTLFTFPP